MSGSRAYRDSALSGAGERLAFGELFVRDFRAPGEDELGAARERLQAIEQVPSFLLSAHLAAATSILFALGALVPPLTALSLGAIAALDLFACSWLRRRKLADFAPHAVVRGAAGYAVLSSLLWSAAAWAALGTSQGSMVLGVACIGGVLALPIGLLAFPGLTLLGCAACALSVLFLSRDPAAGIVAALLSLSLVWLSHRRAADHAALLRQRLADRWDARQAARLVEEFERSGRGWFWETSARGTLSYVSAQLAAHFGTSADGLIGRSLTDLIGADDCLGADLSERTLGFHLSSRLPFSEITVRGNTGGETWWSLSGTPSFDEHGRFLGFRGIGTDLSQQRRSEDEINRLAKYDSLTGLPNRALMRRTLDETLENQQPTSAGGCALLLIDLDRFKNVNDTLGHPVGDALLKQVAQRLANVIGKNGQIGRLGGDEFEAVLPTLNDPRGLASLAERLIQRVSMPYSIEGHTVSIGASVGIAVAPAEGHNADALIRNADLALYAAKSAGRGTFCFFSPEMHSGAQDRQALESDLKKAIGRGELQLVYQPVVTAKMEALSGFEALVRWNHGTRGQINASDFVPLAEECGLIAQIGEWVLRTACAEAAKWPEHVRVSVNLSPKQFADPQLPAIVMGAIANAEIRPNQLELEIAEAAFLDDNRSTDDMFAKLKKLGVRLTLDDFGTGQAALGYLNTAPFDKIKIDQSFVRGAAKSGGRNSAIIRAIVTLADSLGMDTVAQGAETQDELQAIRALGCSHIQGYLFGRPTNGDEAARLAAQSKTATAAGDQFNRPPRQGLLKVASLQWNGMNIGVRVRNISAGGAMLETDRALQPGAQVQLDLPGTGSLGAEVRWSEGKRMGIQFEQDFDLGRLAPGKESGTGARLSGQSYTNLKYSEGAANKKALSRRDLG